MTRASKTLTVLLVAALGLWGCAQNPTPPSTAHAERLRSLEAKCVKMEDDYKGAVNERNKVSQHLKNVEAETVRLEKVRQQLQKELDARKLMQQELEQMKQTMEARSRECDALQVRCERMKKGLQALIGQDDAQLPTPAPTSPVSAVRSAQQGGQS